MRRLSGNRGGYAAMVASEGRSSQATFAELSSVATLARAWFPAVGRRQLRIPRSDFPQVASVPIGLAAGSQRTSGTPVRVVPFLPDRLAARRVLINLAMNRSGSAAFATTMGNCSDRAESRARAEFEQKRGGAVSKVPLGKRDLPKADPRRRAGMGEKVGIRHQLLSAGHWFPSCRRTAKETVVSPIEARLRGRWPDCCYAR